MTLSFSRWILEILILLSAGFGKTSSLPSEVFVVAIPVGSTMMVLAVLVMTGSLKSK